MTTPTDPDDPGYAGLPQYSGGSPSMEPQPQQVTPPREIAIAFWCYIAGALILVVGGLMALSERQQFLAALRETNANQPAGSKLTESQLDQLANFTLTFTIVLVVVIAALYILFAFKLKQGRNWARIVLTIIAAIALLLVISFGAQESLLGLVGDLAAIVGAVLSYLPNSSQFIATMRQQRKVG